MLSLPGKYISLISTYVHANESCFDTDDFHKGAHCLFCKEKNLTNQSQVVWLLINKLTL